MQQIVSDIIESANGISFLAGMILGSLIAISVFFIHGTILLSTIGFLICESVWLTTTFIKLFNERQNLRSDKQ